MIRASRMLVLLVIGAVTALLAGCTSGPGQNAQQDNAGQSTSSSSEAPAPPAEVTITPADQAVNVPPGSPVSVEVRNGTLDSVVLSDQQGTPLPGELAPGGTSWHPTVPLAYGQSYTITANATGANSEPVTTTSSFTTVNPQTLAFPSISPLDGEVVGIGQPIAIFFDQPIANKQAAEDAIRVTTEPHVEGSFYWFSDTEVHWRPRDYWQPGTQITVEANVYGVDLGNGVFGDENNSTSVTVGDAVIATADGATHQMTVEINGEVVRTMPISMGKPSFPSNDGIHVITERHRNFLMDSRTYGLPLNAGGYMTNVEYAVRISNGGEFVHAAPWSVGAQGSQNVSHGCINLSTADAAWFFNTVKRGDIVVNVNTGGPVLQPWDGFGDWQIPWEQWQTGGER